MSALDLEQILSSTTPLPDNFLFGVSTAGFQAEGGFNGPGEPANNWRAWEAEGKVEPSGLAVQFWDRYEFHLDKVVELGCNAFRMGVEWARVEPREGHIDHEALERYAAILAACRERGLRPLVTLHHFTHPHWLGERFWLDPTSPERFVPWVQTAVGALGEHAKDWVTLNEINILALQSYLAGMFPPGGRAEFESFRRAFDHLATAHVLAYDVVHRHQPDASVATNTLNFSMYELDRVVTDILTARLHGISRDDLDGWLRDRRSQYHGSLASFWNPSRFERLLRPVVAKAIPLAAAFPRLIEAVYDSPHECTLDTTQIDFYNPDTSSHLRLPGHKTLGGRNWLPGRLLWDDHIDPAAFAEYSARSTAPHRRLWVAENGLCNRVRKGHAFARTDGWTRERYLREYLAAMMSAIDDGVPIEAYFHWCLVDNYEWGSYEPRFGVYGVDRERGVRWLDTDSMGGDAAGTYRQLIAGLRAGDRSVLTEPHPAR